MNPPAHTHAFLARQGFCVFNDVAVAVRAPRDGRIARAAIVISTSTRERNERSVRR
jgi:acetoin utilization deacetylase AcuC-like enzyme